MRRETSRRRLRRPVTVTPAEGQLPSPARSCCPGSRPALASILAADSSRRPAPPRPVPPYHPASPPQPGPRALVPALRGDDAAIPLPKPSASAGSQTCSVAAAAAAAAAILTGCSPRLRSGTGGGTHTPGGHAPPRPCHAPERNPEWVKESWVGSDPRRRDPRDSEWRGLDGCGRDGMHSGASSNSLERTPSKSKTRLSLPHTFHCGMLYHHCGMLYHVVTA